MGYHFLPLNPRIWLFLSTGSDFSAAEKSGGSLRVSLEIPFACHLDSFHIRMDSYRVSVKVCVDRSTATAAVTAFAAVTGFAAVTTTVISRVTVTVTAAALATTTATVPHGTTLQHPKNPFLLLCTFRNILDSNFHKVATLPSVPHLQICFCHQTYVFSVWGSTPRELKTSSNLISYTILQDLTLQKISDRCTIIAIVEHAFPEPLSPSYSIRVVVFLRIHNSLTVDDRRLDSGNFTGN